MSKVIKLFLLDSGWSLSNNTTYFKDNKKIKIDDESSISLFVDNGYLITLESRKIFTEEDVLLNHFIQQ